MASAQCTYQQNEVDKFTKKKVISTKAHASLFGAMVDYIMFRSVDGNCFLDIHSSVDNSFGAVPEGASLLFRLANDSVVEATAAHLAIAAPAYVGTHIVFFFDATYSMELTALEQLASTPVVGMRIYHTDSYSDIDWQKPRKQEKLQRAAQCLLQAL